MLVRMPVIYFYSYLGIYSDTVTLESLAISCKRSYAITTQLSQCNLKHLPQRNENIFTSILYTNVHNYFIESNPKLETIRHPSVGEWLNKPWYIHTMECYKRNDIVIYATSMYVQEILLGAKSQISRGYIMYDSI